MKRVIANYIHSKNPGNVQEYDRALREIIQHLALLGLWRAGFFEHAAFYGGTALRIIHGLPRFSEDIDFSLLRPRPDFSLESSLSGLRTELAGFGFDTDVTVSEKKMSTVASAFVKANTRVYVLKVASTPGLAVTIPSNQTMKIKLEVDTDPPGNFSTEVIPILFPQPFFAKVYSLPDLFAGKMHCVLFRAWKKRVKGRDWYDMIWFLRRGERLHLSHLEQRMRGSGDWTEERELREGDFLDIYKNRVDATNFTQAASDVLPFIEDPRELDIWGSDFFHGLVEKFRFS